MESKACVVCTIEKSIDNFYNKYRECKQCNIQRSMKHTMRRKIDSQTNENYVMKKIEMCYLQGLN